MYCYGEPRSNNDDYDALVKYHQSWLQLRPRSFDPIFERPADASIREFYPEIWFLSDCHGFIPHTDYADFVPDVSSVTGVQHFDLSKILLNVYDPRIPRLGPTQRAAVRRIEDEVMTIVRRLCGIAISNHRALPAMNTACIAMAMCTCTSRLLIGIH
jgi:hypothetical protein